MYCVGLSPAALAALLDEVATSTTISAGSNKSSDFARPQPTSTPDTASELSEAFENFIDLEEALALVHDAEPPPWPDSTCQLPAAQVAGPLSVPGSKVAQLADEPASEAIDATTRTPGARRPPGSSGDYASDGAGNEFSSPIWAARSTASCSPSCSLTNANIAVHSLVSPASTAISAEVSVAEDPTSTSTLPVAVVPLMPVRLSCPSCSPLRGHARCTVQAVKLP